MTCETARVQIFLKERDWKRKKLSNGTENSGSPFHPKKEEYL